MTDHPAIRLSGVTKMHGRVRGVAVAATAPGAAGIGRRDVVR